VRREKALLESRVASQEHQHAFAEAQRRAAAQRLEDLASLREASEGALRDGEAGVADVQAEVAAMNEGADGAELAEAMRAHAERLAAAETARDRAAERVTAVGKVEARLRAEAGTTEANRASDRRLENARASLEQWENFHDMDTKREKDRSARQGDAW
jgi:hypothetical protein